MMHNKEPQESLWSLMGLLFKAHPWHGVPIGEQMPERLTVYIEIVPTDTVKYEIDKATGILKVDRPQQFSNVCPALYGFVPQTYCGDRVAALCAERTGRAQITGDADPLDICVLTEKVISHGDILLQAIPIGGFRMLDGAEADDKIIAVMAGDAAFGDWQDLHDCPPALLKRLQHYFLTYKMDPGTSSNACEITHVYDRREAHEVIQRSYDDYLAHFGDVKGRLSAAWHS
jgi:inorganic pyrophosphatase